MARNPKTDIELSKFQLEILLDVIDKALSESPDDFSKYDEQQLLILTSRFATILDELEKQVELPRFKEMFE